LARKTLGAQVTQKREWMHFLASKRSVRSLPSIASTPPVVLGAGGAEAGTADWAAAVGDLAGGGFTDDTSSNACRERSASSRSRRAARLLRASVSSSVAAPCASSVRRSLKNRLAAVPGGKPAASRSATKVTP